MYYNPSYIGRSWCSSMTSLILIYIYIARHGRRIFGMYVRCFTLSNNTDSSSSVPNVSSEIPQCIFGPCNLSGGHHHGPVEGQCCAGLAATFLGAGYLSIHQSRRLLSQVYPGLWYSSGSPWPLPSYSRRRPSHGQMRLPSRFLVSKKH